MNGNVLAWMGIASSISGAAGVFAGRKLEWRSAYQQGIQAGRAVADIDSREQQHAETLRAAQEARWQAMTAGQEPPAAGRRNPHGHDGPCSHELGCW